MDTAVYTHDTTTTRTRTEQYATFFLDDGYFGVDVLHVQEILRQQSMTPVPLAPDYISGLINLRGQIVTAMDLGKKLTNRPGASKTDGMNIVVNVHDNIMSLVIDEIGDVIDVKANTIEPVPPTLKKINQKYLRGVCKLDKKLLMLLDVKKLFWKIPKD